MSERTRNLLHPNKLDDFRQWAEAAGYTVEATKGAYEVLRLRKGAAPPLIFHKRDRTDHITTFGAGTSLVQRWLHRRKSAVRTVGA